MKGGPGSVVFAAGCGVGSRARRSVAGFSVPSLFLRMFGDIKEDAPK